MSERRRMLMAIVNQFKWLPYSYEYLLNSLVPVSIDSKNVRNKAKVVEIEGNSCVVNQVYDNNTPTTYNSGITLSGSNNIVTINGTNGTATYFELSTLRKMKNCVGHKVLLKMKIISNPDSLSLKIAFTNWNISASSAISSGEISLIDTVPSSGDNGSYIGFVNLSSNMTFTNVQIQVVSVDLTQAFPFDTPTTLTDNRIVALMNYLDKHPEYNSGEIKSVDISEFNSEPYNLFDEVLEVGSIRLDNGQNNDSITGASRSKNYIKVVPNRSYTLEYPTSTALIVYQYDENYDYIEGHSTSNTTSVSRILTDRTRYVRFAIGNNDLTANVCFHLTGTRTGYAPHTAPQTLSFKYQGSGVGTAHDSMEITDSGYVFTKKMGSMDLGSLEWTYNSSYSTFLLDSWVSSSPQAVAGSGSTASNILCSKYTTINNNYNSQVSSYDKVVFNQPNVSTRLFIKDTAYTDANTFKTAMSGVPLEFELATPQVITIPKKHLGVVDLGSLTWTVSGSEAGCGNVPNNMRYDNLSNANMYCSKYLSIPLLDWNNSTSGIIGANIFGVNKVLAIKDSNFNGKTADEVKQMLSGVYLYYETNTEVSDLTDKISIEACGTLSAAYMTWNKNQLVENGNFESSSGWSTINGTSLSVSSNTAYLTLDGTQTASYGGILKSVNVVNGHKYLVAFDMWTNSTGASNNLQGQATIAGTASQQVSTGQLTTSKKRYSGIITIGSGTSSANFAIGSKASGTATGVIYVQKVQVIDLTIAFGVGNEPTSVDDLRLQFLLQYGYIPKQSAEWTIEMPDCLPNALFNIKCK